MSHCLEVFTFENSIEQTLQISAPEVHCATSRHHGSFVSYSLSHHVSQSPASRPKLLFLHVPLLAVAIGLHGSTASV